MSPFPEKIGKYQICSLLGQGGMGTVYKAIDPDISQEVALKVIRAELLESDNGGALLKRFRNEVIACRRLKHPNIVATYDYHEQDKHCFIVMEYIEGQVLSDFMDGEQVFDFEQIHKIIKQLLSVLSYAHGQGVIHRDIKPANIMIQKDGNIHVMDFGIARMESSTLTVAGTLVGSPGYMSPEQCMGQQVDQRSDIFSAGVVLYQLITNEKPFTGDNPMVTMQKILNVDPVKASLLNNNIPSSFDLLIEKALAKAPKNRYQSADEFLNDLNDFFMFSLKPHHEASRAKGWGLISGSIIAAGISAIQDIFLVKEKDEVHKKKTAHPTGQPKKEKESNNKYFGLYQIVELISKGRISPLYKAYDIATERIIALKITPSFSQLSDVTQNQLLRAGSIWQKLTHENLIQIYAGAVDEKKDQYITTMEYVQGTDLQHIIETGQHFSLDKKIHIISEVCKGIEYLHSKQVIHRDIRPENILIHNESGSVKILDSGVTRYANLSKNDLTIISGNELILKESKHMAPEQVQGQPMYSSDIYSIGILLRSFVNFENDTDSNKPKENVSNVDFKTRLLSIIEKATEDFPKNRYSNIKEMRSEIDSILYLLNKNYFKIENNTDIPKVIFTLHGIRTHAEWQRAFSEICPQNWHCCIDRWHFGYFSIIQFLLPGQRRAKINWFRETYDIELNNTRLEISKEFPPSIIAHSFGTYILGNVLLAYDYIKFDKILLCGSILPTNFPWGKLIERGQVQFVRNEYGVNDSWTQVVKWFVKGTGPSGILGFSSKHDRLEQEEFLYSHSEYFERGHMENNWLLFFNKTQSKIAEKKIKISLQDTNAPWGTYLLQFIIFSVFFLAFTKGFNSKFQIWFSSFLKWMS